MKKSPLEKILEESDKVLAEMEEVVSHYEDMLDSVAVKLPCICGGNTFEGLFQPGVENIVECEKCNAKYKVMVSFDSVLLTEPIEDLNIDKLIKEKTE